MTQSPPAPPTSGCTAVLVAVLPGPDRKRTQSIYRYRVAFRGADAERPGCLVLWEVAGGRQPYQVALERDDAGRTHWHCTCADAVFRGELEPGHVCKHVRALQSFGPPVPGQPARNPVRRTA
jgi:hypothetical protein